MVYWTDNPDAHLCDWQKMTVYGRRVVFNDLKYDWFYLFCAVNPNYFLQYFYNSFFKTSCFENGQRSPLSRALFAKTDKIEFNTKCEKIGGRQFPSF
jgi:hypothetical protein